MQKVEITGQYIVTGSKVTNDNFSFMVQTRSKPTKDKPEKFILIRKGKRYEYLSSLYPEGEGVYRFDTGNPHIRGIIPEVGKFIIELGDLTAVIKKKHN